MCVNLFVSFLLLIIVNRWSRLQNGVFAAQFQNLIVRCAPYGLYFVGLSF
ncbi:hypothetical protein V6Z11_D06G012600 [Gossypium hirsutum]